MQNPVRTLAIETASEACSVALFSGADCIANDHREIGRGHAERLISMIAALPDKGKADRILVSLGPGSFTGVRIGIAAARALGVAWQAQVLGYPTLTLIAVMAQQMRAEPVTVCTTAGHGEWFLQNFDRSGSPQNQLMSLPPSVAAQNTKHSYIVGSKAKELVKLLNENSQVTQTILPNAINALELPDTALSSQISPVYGLSLIHI